jgi:hypothetical protein
MSVSDYLKQNHREPMPAWLANAEPGFRFPRDEFFRSRVCYYPGPASDGHPVVVFGSSRTVHCFVYVDFDYTRSGLIGELDSKNYGFRGYRSHARIDVGLGDLRETPWQPPPIRLSYGGAARESMANPFALLEVLERSPDTSDDHGPERLAILFIAGCGFATFHALFTQSDQYTPYGIMLQDHGFGGNPDQFGRGGLLERLARTHNKLPKFLFVARNTNPWRGYRRVEGLNAEPGGMHAHLRSLYIRADASLDSHTNSLMDPNEEE